MYFVVWARSSIRINSSGDTVPYRIAMYRFRRFGFIQKLHGGWRRRHTPVCQVSNWNLRFHRGWSFAFPIDFCVGLKTEQRQCAACDRASSMSVVNGNTRRSCDKIYYYVNCTLIMNSVLHHITLYSWIDPLTMAETKCSVRINGFSSLRPRYL